jgi:hypothetical protein
MTPAAARRTLDRDADHRGMTPPASGRPAQRDLPRIVTRLSRDGPPGGHFINCRPGSSCAMRASLLWELKSVSWTRSTPLSQVVRKLSMTWSPVTESNRRPSPYMHPGVVLRHRTRSDYCRSGGYGCLSRSRSVCQWLASLSLDLSLASRPLSRWLILPSCQVCSRSRPRLRGYRAGDGGVSREWNRAHTTFPVSLGAV